MSEPKSTYTKEEFWAELNDLGEEEVRVRLFVSKQWGDVGQKYELTHIWLKSQEDKRVLEASSKRDARELETLAIAKRANKISIAAIVITAIFAIVAIFLQK
ncbi:hypothetical protein ACSX1C_00790 [Pseudomonas sp. MBLB4123]|uniref:hypothetical protein n=1 Tax=Pseudomonas sp. MBLB4123 TaxID=3451557 RepID=UPI003F74BA07